MIVSHFLWSFFTSAITNSSGVFSFLVFCVVNLPVFKSIISGKLSVNPCSCFLSTSRPAPSRTLPESVAFVYWELEDPKLICDILYPYHILHPLAGTWLGSNTITISFPKKNKIIRLRSWSGGGFPCLVLLHHFTKYFIKLRLLHMRSLHHWGSKATEESDWGTGNYQAWGCGVPFWPARRVSMNFLATEDFP